ncbi:MAG: HNH endonuclease signature motif containing protein [Sulfurovum sp.]
MIDMREIEKESHFIKAKKEFVKSFTDNNRCEDEEKCDWGKFKESFLEFAKYKCPICEYQVITTSSHIDHFRPKKAGYEFLRCCCDNYMIMCADCNSRYKGVEFPIYDGFKATIKEEISKEKPLLINPREDNIYEYFELFFVKSLAGKLLLEIKVKEGLNGYKKAKAEKTIELYGIGNCETNLKVDSCRLEILETYFDEFIELAEAKEKNDEEEFNKLLNSRRMRKKKEYGFVEFIKKNQFKIDII